MPKMVKSWTKQQTTRAVIVVASMCALGTLLLPWTKEGTSDRNAFSLGRVLNQTGLITTALERCLYDAVVVVPVILGAICAAALLRRDLLAAILATVLGAIELLAAIAVIARVSEGIEVGPWLSIVAGGITAASWPLWQMTRERARV
jgi:hypothetical protein